MLCEVCKSNEANVGITQVIDGEIRKVRLCEECAAKMDVNLQGPVSLTDMLFGMGGDAQEAIEGEDTACPVCHMRRSDYKKTGRLGCPECYDSFREDILPGLRETQRGLCHTGKAPEREKAAARLSEYQRKLNDAITRQAFEEAAQLRDLIRSAGSGEGGEDNEA